MWKVSLECLSVKLERAAQCVTAASSPCHIRKNSVGQFSQQPAKAQNRQVDEETARALVQRVSQLEKESARVQALLKSRDGTLSPNELRALGKLMVFTGAAKDGTEWSFVFEAHSATGSTEVSHGPTLVNKWRASATSCADERDRRHLCCIVTSARARSVTTQRQRVADRRPCSETKLEKRYHNLE